MKKLPEVIDLFSGCGGFALGFQKAGFNITHGIDLNPIAVSNASFNLCWRNGKESNHICQDITSFDPTVIKKKIGKNGCIVIGGPPCQAYSKAGKAKLRSLGLDRLDVNDPRGYLYLDFISFALSLDAKAIVMENVPDSTLYDGNNIPEKVCELLEKEGYEVYWTLLNSADYGVPQVRERIFVFAIKKCLKIEIEIPVPSHFGIGLAGKPTTEYRRFLNNKHFKKPPLNDSIYEWITVQDAFYSLPSVYKNSKIKYKQFPMNQKLKYSTESSNWFHDLMKNWFDKDNKSVTGNCFRNTPRDFPIFERMSPGDNYETASVVADEILEEHLRAAGNLKSNDIKIEEIMRKNVVPPYDRTKFLTKWRRLDHSKPSHTVVAHLGVDTYSHIHPWEPRGITVREAARLQSFPDGFIFQGNMGEAFMQIGNAVPPLLSFQIAKSIKKSFLKSSGGSYD